MAINVVVQRHYNNAYKFCVVFTFYLPESSKNLKTLIVVVQHKKKPHPLVNESN